MAINEGYEQMLDGWYDGVSGTVLEDSQHYNGGWSAWGLETPIEERLDRIEAFLRGHKFIKIDIDGDETEVVYPW